MTCARHRHPGLAGTDPRAFRPWRCWSGAPSPAERPALFVLAAMSALGPPPWPPPSARSGGPSAGGLIADDGRGLRQGGHLCRQRGRHPPRRPLVRPPRHRRSFEYPVLIILAALGMGMMASAGDLISLYVAIELQSLALYILAAFRRDDAKASEAGPEVFRAGRAVLGPAALRRLADLRLRRLDALRRDRHGGRMPAPASASCSAWSS